MVVGRSTISNLRKGPHPTNCDHLMFNTDASNTVLAHQGNFFLTSIRPTQLQGFKQLFWDSSKNK